MTEKRNLRGTGHSLWADSQGIPMTDIDVTVWEEQDHQMRMQELKAKNALPSRWQWEKYKILDNALKIGMPYQNYTYHGVYLVQFPGMTTNPWQYEYFTLIHEGESKIISQETYKEFWKFKLPFEEIREDSKNGGKYINGAME